jgi:UDP-glucose 4-epimerase
LNKSDKKIREPQLTSNLLITGGCGFIGVNFIDFMLKKGFTSFRILDNLSVCSIDNLESMISEHGRFYKLQNNNITTYSFNQPAYSQLSASGSQSSRVPNVELIHGDIRNFEDCKLSTNNINAVVHLAAQSGVPISVDNPMLDCEINIVGTLNMLEACRKNKADKFVFASSGAPLGEVEPPIHEEKVPRPVSPYGASKLAGEAYCNAYYKTFGTKTVVLRFGNVYGPRSSHKNSVVAKFYKRALEGLPLEIYGDGTQTRDFIYVEDLCNAIYLSLKVLDLSQQSLSLSYNKIAGEIFQIATYKETTVDEIATKIKELVNNEAGKKVEIIYCNNRLGDVKRNFSDISKARNNIGFQPKFDLDKGISITWKHYQGNVSNKANLSKTYDEKLIRF